MFMRHCGLVLYATFAIRRSGWRAEPAIWLVAWILCHLTSAGLGHVGFHDSYAARCAAQNVVQIVKSNSLRPAGAYKGGKTGMRYALKFRSEAARRFQIHFFFGDSE